MNLFLLLETKLLIYIKGKLVLQMLKTLRVEYSRSFWLETIIVLLLPSVKLLSSDIDLYLNNQHIIGDLFNLELRGEWWKYVCPHTSFDLFTYIYSSSINTKPRFTMHEKEDASKWITCLKDVKILCTVYRDKVFFNHKSEKFCFDAHQIE